jgi:hypothetical protein
MARLGDDIDDFCIKCKRLTNHSIVSILDEKPAKVRCRTCYHDHDYRHEEPLPSKKELKKAQLALEALGLKGSAEDVDLDLPLDEEEEEGDDESSGEVAARPEEEDDAPTKPVAAKKATKKAAKKASKALSK